MKSEPALRTLVALRPRAAVDRAVFAREQQARLGALASALWITERPPPRLGVVPFRRDLLALVALEGEPGPRAAALRELAGSTDCSLEAWEVESTAPVVRSGPCATTLLTAFRKRPGIEDALFHHRWFEEHTPLTLKIHPVTGYVRNVVKRACAPGSTPWDGIVTEDFASERHLTSIGVFGQGLFGRGPEAVVNAVRVARHVRSFLDLRTIATYLVTEITLR